MSPTPLSKCRAAVMRRFSANGQAFCGCDDCVVADARDRGSPHYYQLDIHHVRRPPLTVEEVQAIVDAPLDAPLTTDFTALIYVMMHSPNAGWLYAERHTDHDMVAHAYRALISASLSASLGQLTQEAHAARTHLTRCLIVELDAVLVELAAVLKLEAFTHALNATCVVWHIPLPEGARVQPFAVTWHSIAKLDAIAAVDGVMVHRTRWGTQITFQTSDNTIALSVNAACTLAAAGYSAAAIDADIVQLRDGRLTPEALLVERVHGVELWDAQSGWREYVNAIKRSTTGAEPA